MKITSRGTAEMSDEELIACWTEGQALASALSDQMLEHNKCAGRHEGRFKDVALALQIEYNAACIIMASVLARFADEQTRTTRMKLAGEIVNHTLDAYVTAIETGKIDSKRIVPALEH